MRSHLLWLRTILASALLPMLGACASQGFQRMHSRSSEEHLEVLLAAQQDSPEHRIPDEQITGVILTAEDAGVSFAHLALQKSHNPAVKAYAHQMIVDHAAIMAGISSVADRSELGPDESIASRDVRDMASSRRDALRALSGAAFDSAYVAAEVISHREALAAIDRVLLPSSLDPQLRVVLANARPAVQMQLASAEHLNTTLLAAANGNVQGVALAK